MYNFDQDLIPAIENFDVFDLTDPEETRRKLLDASKKRPLPDKSGVIVEDFTISSFSDGYDIPIRVYMPDSSCEQPRPAILNIHGGGFVIGRIETDEKICLQMARELNAVVISVGYRLAPEFKYPAAINDCYSALIWTSDNANKLGIDQKKIAVHGTSAGGGLAASVAIMARDRNGPDILFQYLDMPELDDRLNTLSMERFHDLPGWNTPNAKISWAHYLGDAAAGEDVSVYAAPSRISDAKSLPDTYIGIMEFDPCRSEAVAYGEKLFEGGASVETHVFPGAYHLAYLVEHSYIAKAKAKERIRVLTRVFYSNQEQQG